MLAFISPRSQDMRRTMHTPESCQTDSRISAGAKVLAGAANAVAGAMIIGISYKL